MLRIIGLYFTLFAFIAGNVFLWMSVRDIREEWPNVPPAMSEHGAQSYALGDQQLAYRMSATLLQNLGENDGDVRPLLDYNYQFLNDWFVMAHKLDPQSSIVPILAGYVYSSVDDPEKLGQIIGFLVDVGREETGRFWRWLVRAMFLARYKLDDLDLTIQIAEMLENHPSSILPAWTRNLRAYILSDVGEKQAAKEIMLETIKSQHSTLDPSEINNMIFILCTELLSEQEKAQSGLCEG